MSSPDIVSVEKFEILPSNSPANGVYSFSSGTPLITFAIGKQAKLLRTSSVRINGKFKVKLSNGSSLDNLGLKAVSTTDVKINPRVGIHSAFQNVSILSNETGQTLESVRQYGRMVASILPSVQSEEDFLSHSGLIGKQTAEQDSCDAQLNNAMSFSVPLFSGIMQSGIALPLGNNGLRGLSINIELSPDVNVLSSATPASYVGCYYEISDLSISGDMLVPSAIEQEKMMVPSSGQFVFNTFQNLYSVLDSSDSTQNFNLASSKVLSVFHNFLPTTHTNSLSFDGFATDELKNINSGSGLYDDAVTLKKVSFSRGGLKLKLDYDIDVEVQSTQGIPETGVFVSAINALQPFNSASKMLNQPQLYPFGTKDSVISSTSSAAPGTGQAIIQHPDTQVLKTVESDRNFAIGLNLDRISQQGMDFKSQAYSIRIQSSNDGASPISMYTYYLAKNLLQYSPQGISVSS